MARTITMKPGQSIQDAFRVAERKAAAAKARRYQRAADAATNPLERAMYTNFARGQRGVVATLGR